jgi:prepilin-type N-terminal cleavage/methylation domain-containing protein
MQVIWRHRGGRGTRAHDAGFSLVELVLVLLVIAIMSAIAAPRYGDALARFRADAAARRVANDLALVQARARSTGTSCAMNFDVSGNRYQLPAENDLKRSGTTYTVDLAGDPYYASVGTVVFGATTAVTFNGFGVPSNAGYVRLSVGKAVRTISIDADNGVATVQ